MDLSTQERSIKVIPFDGKDKDWREWSSNFLARANLYGYKDVLLGNMKVPREEKVSLIENEAMARECNLCAYSNLILSCKGVPFSIVDGAKTEALPNGDARTAWIALKERYQVENATSKVELKRQFNELVMKDGQDPDDWFMEMDHLRKQLQAMGSKVQDEDYVAHVLTNLTAEYSELVTVLEEDLEGLTIQKLRERVRSFYRRKKKSEGSAEDNNQALIHIFKGRCNNCGKYGHKGANCSQKRIAGGKRVSKKEPTCHFCNKPGHIKKNCFKLKNQKDDTYKRSDEVALIAKQMVYQRNEIWYADSGASRHMTNDLTGLIDVEKGLKEHIAMGNGTALSCEIKGSLKLGVQANGDSQIKILLRDVLYVPELKANLFSLSTVTRNGRVEASINKNDIILKGITETPLRLFEKLENESLYHIDCERMNFTESAYASLENDVIEPPGRRENRRNAVDVNLFHKRLGHPSEFYTRETAEKYNVHLTGKMEVCEACTYGKGQQKPVKKFTESRTSIPLERIFVDTSSLPSKSLGGSNFGIMIVDDATRYKWSFFVKSKGELGKTVQRFICGNAPRNNIKYLRCDNAGENQALRELCDKYGIKMEWTAPYTPQENGVVERGFVTVRQKAVAMMAQVSLEDEFKQSLWAEALSTATTLSNITVSKPNELESSYVRFFGEVPPILKSLKIFGSTSYVTKRNIKNKYEKRAFKCMMMGYAQDHASDCYRLLNLESEKIIMSRDVIWDEKLSHEYNDVLNREVQSESDVDEDTIGLSSANGLKHKESPKESMENGETTSDKVTPCIDQLQSLVAVRESTESVIIPKSFEKAVREVKWKDAMIKELSSIQERNAWTVESKKSLGKENKVLNTRWVYTVKGDGTYKARLAVLGYFQRPGVDFWESYSPVVSDPVIRTLLCVANHRNWDIQQIDVETAFLNARLKEKVYINIPRGARTLQESLGLLNENCILKLNKALYGLVQAPRAWMSEMKSTLRLGS